MLKSLKIYSQTDKKVVDFQLDLIDDKSSPDELMVYEASYKDEKYRFSPQCTDEELLRMSEKMREPA